MVAGQDASLKDQGKRHRRPVAGIARNPPTGHHLHVLVEAARDDLDHPLVDKSEHVMVQALSVVVGEAPLFDDRTDSALQFVLGFVPLLLGDHHSKVGMGEQLSPPRAEQLGDEHTRVRDNNHSACRRRMSNICASSSSDKPVSSRTWPTVSPSRASARRTSSSSRARGI